MLRNKHAQSGSTGCGWVTNRVGKGLGGRDRLLPVTRSAMPRQRGTRSSNLPATVDGRNNLV
jgi:hypothetical protein